MEKDGTEVEVTVNKVNDSFWHKITPRFSNFVEEITKVLTESSINKKKEGDAFSVKTAPLALLGKAKLMLKQLKEKTLDEKPDEFLIERTILEGLCKEIDTQQLTEKRIREIDLDIGVLYQYINSQKVTKVDIEKEKENNNS